MHAIESLKQRFTTTASTINPQLSSFEEVIEYLKLHELAGSAQRIAYLCTAGELEEGDEPLSIESVKGFVAFMCRFADLGEPLLGLSPQGFLGSTWRIADDKHLYIQFLNANEAMFSSVSPGTDDGHLFRMSGRGSLPDVLQTLRAKGMDKWRNSLRPQH